ncbi:MAG TPA: protein-disulfide reductase DsbD domain-containing protein [Tepidisphaeraceae bacterium]
MAIRKLLGAAIVLCMVAAQASAAHVRAELLANVSSIQAGKPFWLGVRLSIDPGWHVYWKNPGDAGLPTRVTFVLPDGFIAGPLQYPTPHRFDQAGNIVAFGYEDSVLLLAQVTPPANLGADFHGDFRAAVSWLVCSNVCIPGKATATLTLGAAPAASAANSADSAAANQELFDDWMSQVPVDANNVATVSTMAKKNGDCEIGITWRDPAPDSIEFIPGALDDYNITNTQVKTLSQTTTISFNVQALAGKTPPPAVLQAVVGYMTQDGKHRGANVSLALGAGSANNQ